MMSIKHYIFFLHFFKKITIKYNGDKMSKESFKSFARKNPDLANQVLEGKVTWQQLYELYEIYGEENDIWNKYLSNKITQIQPISIKDIFESLKTIDLNTFQEGIANIQKTLGIIQSLGIGNKYERKPLYQRLDDR